MEAIVGYLIHLSLSPGRHPPNLFFASSNAYPQISAAIHNTNSANVTTTAVMGEGKEITEKIGEYLGNNPRRGYRPLEAHMNKQATAITILERWIIALIIDAAGPAPVQYLRNTTGASEESVRAALRKLETLGYLTRYRKTQTNVVPGRQGRVLQDWYLADEQRHKFFGSSKRHLLPYEQMVALNEEFIAWKEERWAEEMAAQAAQEARWAAAGMGGDI